MGSKQVSKQFLYLLSPSDAVALHIA